MFAKAIPPVAPTAAELPDPSQVVDLEILAAEALGADAWHERLTSLSKVVNGDEDYLVADQEQLNELQAAACIWWGLL